MCLYSCNAKNKILSYSQGAVFISSYNPQNQNSLQRNELKQKTRMTMGHEVWRHLVFKKTNWRGILSHNHGTAIVASPDVKQNYNLELPQSFVLRNEKFAIC